MCWDAGRRLSLPWAVLGRRLWHSAHACSRVSSRRCCPGALLALPAASGTAAPNSSLPSRHLHAVYVLEHNWQHGLHFGVAAPQRQLGGGPEQVGSYCE